MLYNLRNLGRKICLSIVLFAAIICSSTLYGHNLVWAQAVQAGASGDNWLIYWYICGSDLESLDASATNDIAELMDVNLPPNVQVLMLTGGAEEWHNNTMNPGEVGIYLYNSEGFHELGRADDADFGSGETLTDFLKLGKENFDRDDLRRAFIFWDHGGGSAAGVCLDERTGNSLSLNDIRNAFVSVYGTSDTKPPFEMVGFDACLMASYDTANALQGISRYMTGSEEVEPGNGWYYTGWVGALADNPAMRGDTLGKAICDSYMEGCVAVETEDTATLSVIDLSKLAPVGRAYKNFGIEALEQASDNPRGFFATFGRKAQEAENYGGNTRAQGYSNMVDLGDLARRSADILPRTSRPLIEAINNAVIYKVHGKYRRRGMGLSGFHSYDGDQEIFAKYVEQEAVPLPQKCLYYYLLYGQMPMEAEALLASGSTESITTIPDVGSAQKQKIFRVEELEDTVVNIDKDGYAYVTLTPEQMDLLSSVHCQLTYVGVDQDVIILLGSDSNIVADWENGVFKDNFTGKWPMLDGHPVYVEITTEEDNYNLYSVPIKLNDEECNLQIAYTYNDDRYHILGARKGINTKGMGSRNLVQLKSGDKITTIHYGMTISGNDKTWSAIDVDTFTIGANPVFADEDVGDGLFGYFFEFVTPTDDSALSKMVSFTIEDGQITADNE